MSVVATVELDDFLSTREPTRNAKCGHRGLGSRTHEAHAFERRNHGTQPLCEFDLALRVDTKAGTVRSGFRDGCNDLRVCMTK